MKSKVKNLSFSPKRQQKREKRKSEHTEKSQLCRSSRWSSSPWSLHGHYTDLKGRTWNPCKCDQQSRPWLGRPHMIKYNCKEPFPNASVVFLKVGRKDLKPIPWFFFSENGERKNDQRVCVYVCEKRWILPEIKVRLTSFKPGLVFTCTRWAGRLCRQIKYAGVQGQRRHTQMIDGSVWMLKSTEHEHVSAAQTRPSTQHLFKGQVLQNTLTVQPLPLSYHSVHWE